MDSNPTCDTITVGVLALQGAFLEHVALLRKAVCKLATKRNWIIKETRTASDLATCDALIIPGGESTAISLIAQRTKLLEPLRNFVKVSMKPTWGTCAGLILLAEAANKTKQGGQELIGGLDIEVDRNHFGRQIESFEAQLDLSFLGAKESVDSLSSLKQSEPPFRAIFIRAPVVNHILHSTPTSVQDAENVLDNTTIILQTDTKIPSHTRKKRSKVEILARLPTRTALSAGESKSESHAEAGDIIAVKQDNIFGTSFHPELTDDDRIHVWWLEQVLLMIDQK